MAEGPIPSIQLPSGCNVDQPLERLQRFFGAEFAYYDAIPCEAPNEVMPIDLLVTAAVNARLGTAETIRRIHGDLRVVCNPLLAQIDVAANLATLDLEPVADLIHAAVSCEGVAFAVATKILHRKRRGAMPMLDSVLLNHYTGGAPGSDTPARFYYKPSARKNAMELLSSVRDDLLGAEAELTALQQALAQSGFPVTRVRILDALLWTEYEARGVYRTVDPEPHEVEAVASTAEYAGE